MLLDRKFSRGDIDDVAYEKLTEKIGGELEKVKTLIKSLTGKQMEFERKEELEIELEVLEEMAVKLRNEFVSGSITEGAYKDIREELDEKLLGIRKELKGI
ncbi:MAG: hypothetical protein A7315_06440 [Candidatus Altiarchaeales archaeon WOR_SM1_79]|nr:MAG: hypothetical protein A7315_06440 [Candidatus Altiarchaeales archaeon WOR_SM1_79]